MQIRIKNDTERGLIISVCSLFFVGALLLAQAKSGQHQTALERVAQPSHKQHQISKQPGIAMQPSNKIAPLANVVPSPFATTPSWSQDFSTSPDGTPDPSFWNVDIGNNDGWGNDELEYYTARPSNLAIRDRALVLRALREQYDDYHYTSARIQTAGKFDFTYGRLQIVAKLPTGRGIWPAIWLWPTDDKYSSQPLLPAEQDFSWLANGEIDITEGQAQGDDQFSGSAHAVNHHPDYNEQTGYVTVADPSETYHTYGLDWTPDSLVFSVDNQSFYTLKNPHTGFKDWPYDQKYHLILNVALGGSMSQNLRDQLPPYGVDNAGSPWTMSVRSVTYYPLAAQ